MTEETTKMQDSSNTWKHRRRIAYISLLSMLVVMVLSLFYLPEERLKALENIITYYFIINGSVVGAYMGFATWLEVKK